MRKADRIKLSVIVGVSLLAFIVGCVDTSVQPIPTSVNYRSQISVVDLTVGTGTATLNVYGGVPDPDSLKKNILSIKYDLSTSLLNGSLTLGAVAPTTSYQDVPAGAKLIVVSYSSAATDNFKLTTDTDYKMRLFIIGDNTAGGRTLVKSTERYIFQAPGTSSGDPLFPAGYGWVKFFNGSPDVGTVGDVVVKGGKIDTTFAFSGDFGKGSGYLKLPSGTAYSFTVRSDKQDTLATFSQTPASQHRYTTVIYDAKASLKTKVLTDD